MPTGERGQMPATATRSSPASGAIHHHREVEDAEIILALIDRHAHPARAEAAIDGDIETPFLPKTHFLGHKGVAECAERQPRQRHLDRRGGAHDRGRRKRQAANSAPGRAGQHQEGTTMCSLSTPVFGVGEPAGTCRLSRRRMPATTPFPIFEVGPASIRPRCMISAAAGPDGIRSAAASRRRGSSAPAIIHRGRDR